MKCRALNQGPILEFVTFHSDKPDSTHGVHPNVDANAVSYARMIDLLFRSARIFNPSSLCTVLTDSRTSLRAISGRYTRVNTEIDHTALMLSRSIAQLNYIEHSNFHQPIVLIDSDILVNASLAPLLEFDFDVAVTWRVSFKMPINGGLLILNNRRPEIAKQFFRDFVETYKKHHADQSGWYGDQLALRDCVGMHYKDMGHEKIVEVNGCRILLLSCDAYNFSPKDQYEAINSSLGDKFIVHFKGQRKRLMTTFFEAWLKSHEKLSPWGRLQVWLAHRRLKENVQKEQSRHSTGIDVQ